MGRDCVTVPCILDQPIMAAGGLGWRGFVVLLVLGSLDGPRAFTPHPQLVRVRPGPAAGLLLRARPGGGRAATVALMCNSNNERGGNLTTSMRTEKPAVKWSEWRPSVWENLGVDGAVDSTMIKNDIAVLSINTLAQAVVELVSKGPKATPGMTLTDWVIVSRYFSVAGQCVCARARRPGSPRAGPREERLATRRLCARALSLSLSLSLARARALSLSVSLSLTLSRSLSRSLSRARALSL